MRRLLFLALALLLGVLNASAQRLVYSEQHAGLTLAVGNQSVTYFGAPSSSSSSTWAPAAPAGDSMEVSWEWDAEDGSPTRKITVRLERRPNQSIRNWAKAFREAVDAMMELYPPNVSESLGVSLGAPRTPFALPTSSASYLTGTGVVLEVSWKHDPDKESTTDGPLQPVTVTAKVEQREGESSREAARRLGQVVEALREAFPPNVPETP